MEILIVVFYVGGLIFIANRQLITGQPERFLRPMMYAIPAVLVIVVFTLFNVITTPEAVADGFTVNPLFAIPLALICAILTGIAFMTIRSYNRKRKLLPLQEYLPDNTLDAENPVHIVAYLLLLTGVVFQFSAFILIGGLAGITESVSSQGADILSLITNAITYILVAALGVGLWIRRNEMQVIKRLGLRIPEQSDVIAGVGTGVGMFIVIQILATIITLITAPEVMEQQLVLADEIVSIYGESIFTGFLLAITAALGEEILFRGALQPVFGVMTTTIFFALMHLQYTLSPVSLLIFFVGLSFAWLRVRFSTGAAIIAHFVYNLIPFLLLALVPGMV